MSSGETDVRTEHDFARALCELLVAFGASGGEQLERSVGEAVQQMQSALAETADDGRSLSPLDVVRIRANKLFARHVPAAVYRDVARRTEARARIGLLATAWLGDSRERGSWFPRTRPP